MRLRRALQNTTDLVREHPPNRTPAEMSSADRRRLGLIGSTSRRRPRSPSPLPTESSADHDTYGRATSRSRRTKRRRLGSPPPTLIRKPIKYGYHGQVETGRLKLELVSCDGGEHRDPKCAGLYLGPENLLRNDKSVYCSETRSVTIIVRHTDDTPFCLDKLHIVGPEHGFSAPVRAGIVHVAMTMNDLQKYIDLLARPRIAGAGTSTHRGGRQSSIQQSPEQLSLADALRDPELNAAFEELDRSASRDGETPQPWFQGIGIEPFEAYDSDLETHCEIPISSNRFEYDGSTEPVSLLFDEDLGPEDTSSQEVLDYRLQRLRLHRRRYEMESHGRAERWTGRPPPLLENDRDRERYSLSRLDALMARSRVYDTPAAMSANDTTNELDEDVSAEHTDALDQLVRTDKEVHTKRFLIRSTKSKVALHFDPPISGRFIMIKMWSGEANVDVQTVLAEGWGGGRFFPAVEFR